MKCRNIELILYDIEKVYECKKICEKNNFNYAYILHDKDLKDDLTLKKSHFHFQVYYDNQKEFEKWASIFNIEENYIQKIKDKKSAIRYLIHADNNEKENYAVANIVSNFKVIDYFDDLTSDTQLELQIIMEQINKKERINKRDLWNFCIELNIYKTYRAYYSVLRDLIEEHNLLFTKVK